MPLLPSPAKGGKTRFTGFLFIPPPVCYYNKMPLSYGQVMKLLLLTTALWAVTLPVMAQAQEETLRAPDQLPNAIAPALSAELSAPPPMAPPLSTNGQEQLPPHAGWEIMTLRQQSDKRFNLRDRDKDNKISSYEYSAYSKTRFGNIDSDKSGYTTLEEYTQAFGGPPSTPGKPAQSEIYFSMEDKDKDGRITQYECLTNATEFFKKIDTNKDDIIDRDEFFAYQEEMAKIENQTEN